MHLNKCILWSYSNFTKMSLAKKLLLKKNVMSASSKGFHTRRLSQQIPVGEGNNVKDSGAKFVTFNEMVNFRRTEAERSILVQVQSARSAKDLHAYCSSMGNVKYMFHYSLGIEPLHFILVEFGCKAEIENILSASSYLDISQVVPVRSPFLWFRAVSKKDSKSKYKKPNPLDMENAATPVGDDALREELNKCNSISDQIVHLYERTRLNDVGTRLRFLTARQIETSLSGMFPHAKVFPFGSSVNGFGRMGCDLDLVMRLMDDTIDESKRLVFHGKASAGTERSASQKTLESIGDLIQLFLPGCAQVRRILQARVPIVKYNQQLTGIECDLSMTNMSGYHMSDLLYIMGCFDERVKPLVYAIRKWAKEVGLTNSSPGKWITNFSLTLLVIAFLQRPANSAPILPSVSSLIKAARSSDRYITEDGINCTFLRDIRKMPCKVKNEESLETLLKEFFEFYAQYDFSSRALSLNEAVSFPKPEHSPMYIVNPLERGLNVSKNVSMDEVEKFKTEVRNAAWVLESQENKTSNWGLLSTFNRKRRLEPLTFPTSRQERLMEISALFEDDLKDTEVRDVDFKNETVKKQIENIRSDTKQKLDEIKSNNQLQKSNR